MALKIKPEHHIHGWYFAAAFMGMLLVQDYLAWTGAQVETIPYSQFLDMAHGGKLDNLVVGPNRVEGDIKDAEKGKPSRFVSDRVDPALADTLSAEHLTFSGSPPPSWISQAIGWFAPLVFFWAIWLLVVRKMAGGAGAGGFGGMGGLMNIGRSRARVYVEADTKIRFSDVAGADEAKAELMEIVDFLKAPERYGRLGAHIPKGVLLVGPPGTGKTLLARAVAGETGVPFFSISGSEFVEMIVGVGAARVRDMFKEAREKAPAIIFIDEIDALGGARNGPGLGGHDEKEQTLNQLLSEMDGFDPSSGLVILAATNRPEVLDPALLRAGRFDRQVLVDRPDRKGREEILRIHMRKVKLAAALEPEALAVLTPGFTGADLANLVNEAALLATRRNASEITLVDFEAAIERLVAGLEKRTRILGKRERALVAHHEIGHAIVAMALPDTDPVHKISIIPRGIAALGYTMQRPSDERFLMSRSDLVHRMTVLLGGRAAEELIFHEVSTGAADDLVKATEIARSMAARFGMDFDLGLVSYEPDRQTMLGAPAGGDWRPRGYGEITASGIDHAVKALIDDAYRSASAILATNEALVRSAAAQLLERETLEREQLEAIARDVTRADVGGETKLLPAA